MSLFKLDTFVVFEVLKLSAAPLLGSFTNIIIVIMQKNERIGVNLRDQCQSLNDFDKLELII